MKTNTPLRSGRPIVCLAAAGTSLLIGCAERRVSIMSDPPGAIVHVNDTEVGVTPVEVIYTWNGVYDVRLTKPGYDPIVTSARARPGARWDYTLEPADADADAVVDRARAMREAVFQTEPIEPGEPPM